MHDAASASYAGVAAHTLQLNMCALHERQHQLQASSSTHHGQANTATHRLCGTSRRGTARHVVEDEGNTLMMPLLTLHGHFRCAAVVSRCGSSRHAAPPPPLSTSYVLESTPDKAQTTRASSSSPGGSPAPVRQGSPAALGEREVNDMRHSALRDGEAAEPHAALRITQPACHKSSSNHLGDAAEGEETGRQAKTRHTQTTTAALGEAASSSGRDNNNKVEEEDGGNNSGGGSSSAGTVLLAAECSHDGITATTNASSCCQVGNESGGRVGGAVMHPSLLPAGAAIETYAHSEHHTAASRLVRNAMRGASWSTRTPGRHVNGARHPCRLLRPGTPGPRLVKVSVERASEAQTSGAVRRLSSIASSSVITTHPNAVAGRVAMPYDSSHGRHDKHGLASFVRDGSAEMVGQRNGLTSLATADTHDAAADSSGPAIPSRTLWLAGKDGSIAVHDAVAPSRVLRAWWAQGQRTSGRTANKSVVVVTTLATLPGRTSRVAAGLSDGTLQVYCATTTALLAATRAHTAAVTCVLPVPPPRAGSLAAMQVHDDDDVYGTKAATASMTEAQADAAVQETTLLTASLDGTLARWRVEEGLTCLVRLRGSWCGVHAVALAASASFAFSGSDNGTLRMWNLVQHTQVELDKAEKAILAAHSTDALLHNAARSVSPRLRRVDMCVSPARRRGSNNVYSGAVHDDPHVACESARSNTSEAISTRSMRGLLRAEARTTTRHASPQPRTSTPEPRHPTSPAAMRGLSVSGQGQPPRAPSHSQQRRRRRVVTATTSVPRPAPSRLAESLPRAMSVSRTQHAAQTRTPYAAALASVSPSLAVLSCEESTVQAVKRRAARVMERPGPPPPALEQKLKRVVRGFVAGRTGGTLASHITRAHATVAFDDATRLCWPVDQAHQQGITALLVVADRLLISASRDGLGNVFALPTGQHLRTLSVPQKTPLTAALLDTVRGVVWLGGTDGSLAGFDVCDAAMPLVRLLRPRTVQVASTFAVLSSYRTHFFYLLDQPVDSAGQVRRVVCAEQRDGLVAQLRDDAALDSDADETVVAEKSLCALAERLSARQQTARALQAAKAKMAAMGTIEEMELADMRLCGRVMQRQHVQVFLQRFYCTWRGWAARRAVYRQRHAQTAVMANARARCLRCHYWTKWRCGVLQCRDTRLSRRGAAPGTITASSFLLGQPTRVMRGVFDETRALLHATRRVTARHTAHMVTLGTARTMLFQYFCLWREGAERTLCRSRRAVSYNTLLLSFAGSPYCAASTLLAAMTRRAVRKAWQDRATWLLQKCYAAGAQRALLKRYFAQWQRQASKCTWSRGTSLELTGKARRAERLSSEDEDAWALVEPLSCLFVRPAELRRRCFHRWLDYSRHVTREARLAEEKLTLCRERVLLQDILDNPLSNRELTREVQETQATIAGVLQQRERAELAERKLRQEMAGLRMRDALDVLLAGYDARRPVQADHATPLPRSAARAAYSATTTPRAWQTRSLARNHNAVATSAVLESTADAHRRTRSWGATAATHSEAATESSHTELVVRDELLLRMVHAVMRALKALALHCGRDDKEIVKAYALALRLPVLESAPDTADRAMMSYDMEGSTVTGPTVRRGQGKRGGFTPSAAAARTRRPSLTTGTPRSPWAATSTTVAPLTSTAGHLPPTSLTAPCAASTQPGSVALTTSNGDTLCYPSLSAAFDDTVAKLQELLRTVAAEAGATLELEELSCGDADWVVSALLRHTNRGGSTVLVAAEDANASPLKRTTTMRMANSAAGGVAVVVNASRSESMGTQSGRANNTVVAATYNNNNNTSTSTLSALDEAVMTDGPHLLQLARPSITRSASAQSGTTLQQQQHVTGVNVTAVATQDVTNANALMSGATVAMLPRWLQHVSLAARRAVAALTVRLVALYDSFVAHSEMALERAATFSTRGQSDTRALPLCALCSERTASLLLRLATLLLGIAHPQLWQRQIKLHEMHVMAAKARSELAPHGAASLPLASQPRSRRIPPESAGQADTTWLYKADSHKSADGATTPSVSVCRDDSPQPHRVPWSPSATETGIRVPPIPIATATATSTSSGAGGTGLTRPQMRLSAHLLRSPATSTASSSVVFNNNNVATTTEQGRSGLVERGRNDSHQPQYGSAALCGELGGPQMGTPDEDPCGHTRSTSFSVRAFSVASTPHSSAVTPRSVHSAAQHVARPYLGFRVNVGRDPETGRPSISIREVVESFLNAAGEEVRGPAAAAGLHAGDQLVRFAGYAVTDLAAFNAIVSRHVRNGAELAVVVRRRGEEVSTTIRVGTRVC